MCSFIYRGFFEALEQLFDVFDVFNAMGLANIFVLKTYNQLSDDTLNYKFLF